MALSPSDAYIKGRAGAFYNFSGEPERALQLLDEAAELDPFLPVWCIEERVAALYRPRAISRSDRGGAPIDVSDPPGAVISSGGARSAGRGGPSAQIVAEAIASASDLTTDYVENHESIATQRSNKR